MKIKSPWNRVLHYLSFRPRSEKEIREYLGEDCTEELIIKLKDYKFIDDAAFQKWYTESRGRSRPRSQKLLNLELKRKGIAPVEVDDFELAIKALAKKHPKSREQAIRFLQYRGFAWETIAKVVKKAYNGGDVN